MFKKIIYLLIALLIVGVTGVAIAQEAANATAVDQQQTIQATTTDEAVTAQELDISEPTLLPDSKFYFLKTFQQ
ncbi:MAG: hypothetical protein AAB740_02965, partial [Patescibacteria group bacterium]